MVRTALLNTPPKPSAPPIPNDPLPDTPKHEQTALTKRLSRVYSIKAASKPQVEAIGKVKKDGKTFNTRLHDLRVSTDLEPGRSGANIVATETRVEMKSSSPTLSYKKSGIWKRMGLTREEDTSSPSGGITIRQGKKLFTVYKIIVKSGSQEWAVYKRYSEFDALDRSLKKLFPYLHKQLPELPPKRFLGSSLSPTFIEHRAKALHRYIQHVFCSPLLLRSEPVRDFLCGSSNISSISAPVVEHSLKPLTQVDEEDTSSDDHSVSGSVTIPDAVFSTAPLPSAMKPALRQHNAMGMALKKVGWRQSVVSNKSEPIAESKHDEITADDVFESMLYPLSSKRNSITKHVGIEDFYLLKMIGKGSFGKVMLAQYKPDQQVYAIKCIAKSSVKKKSSRSNGSRPHDIDHIMAERNVLIRSVKHPFLIGLKWAFQTKEKLYFVTEYVNGGELFFHLQKETRFSELRARFYAAEIVSALEYLHTEADVVYRDLKPENILLDAEGHIKLTDFGMAKEHFHRKNRGRTQTFCGTPEYLAPEILRKEAYGFPVDWWCLGSVLYEMLVGLPPFYSKDTTEMFEKIQNDKIKFPPYVGIRARSIISGLLHRSAYFRLGTGANNTSNPQAIKSHPFFEGLDWKKLYRREYTPPFVPSVSHSYDLRNIDPTFVNEPIPRSVLEDGILRQERGDNFQVEVATVNVDQAFEGFTFVPEERWLLID